MNAFYEYLVGQGLSPRTVSIYMRLIQGALREVDLANVGAVLLADYASRLPYSHSLRGQFAAAVNHYWRSIGRWDGPIKAIRVPPQAEMVSVLGRVRLVSSDREG